VLPWVTVVLLVSVSVVLAAATWAWLHDVRVILVSPVDAFVTGETVLLVDAQALALVTDVASLCIDPGAKADVVELRICSQNILLPASRAATVVARFRYVALLKEFAGT
jgi:hypothetical protein